MQNNKNNNLKDLKIYKKQLKNSFCFRCFSGGIQRMKSREDIFFLYKINNGIKERNLLQPDQRILIAVSGGQDSICLLRVLFQLKKKWNWKLGIIHCDHRWDPTSKFQAEHVACLAVKFQIDFFQGITIESVQKEGIARIWRYDIIQTIAISNNYTAIITGHTASDRIETLLYNLTRGSGLHGLQSIRWKRNFCSSRFTQSSICRTKSFFLFKKLKYRKKNQSDHRDLFYFLRKKNQLHLIRPLLETTRTEIRNLLTVWNFPVWPDESNKELRISRNRIRHRLIPYIRIHYNLNIDQTLSRWAEIVQFETLYIEQLTNYILSKIEIKISSLIPRGKKVLYGDGTLGKNFFHSAISIDLLRSLPLAIQRRVLKQYIYRSTGRILGFQYIEQIRLSCLFQNLLLYSVDFEWNESREEKKNPWIIFPGEIKLLIRKNFIFIFSPLGLFNREEQINKWDNN